MKKQFCEVTGWATLPYMHRCMKIGRDLCTTAKLYFSCYLLASCSLVSTLCHTNGLMKQGKTKLLSGLMHACMLATTSCTLHWKGSFHLLSSQQGISAPNPCWHPLQKAGAQWKNILCRQSNYFWCNKKLWFLIFRCHCYHNFTRRTREGGGILHVTWSWPHKLCSHTECIIPHFMKSYTYSVFKFKIQNTFRDLANLKAVRNLFTLSSVVQKTVKLGWKQQNIVEKISVLLPLLKHDFFCNIYKAGLCDPPTQWNYSQSSLSRSQILPDRVRVVNKSVSCKKKTAFMLQPWLVQHAWVLGGYSFMSFTKGDVIC